MHAGFAATALVCVRRTLATDEQLIAIHVGAIDVGIGGLTRQFAKTDGFVFVRIHWYGQAIIKHEAFPVKMRATFFFRVGEDATMQLAHIPIAFLFHQNRELFATDASRAIHQDFLVFRDAGFVDPLRKIIKVFEVRKDGTLEMADLRLVLISHIYHHKVFLFFQRFTPFARTQMGPAIFRIQFHIGAQRHDFGTVFTDQTAKGNVIAQIFFELGGGKARKRPYMLFIGVAGGDGARNRAIDSFLGNIDASEQVQFDAECFMGLDERRNLVDRREIVIEENLAFHIFKLVLENTAYRNQMRGFWIIIGLCLTGIPLQAQDIVKCGTASVMEAMRRGKSLPDSPPTTQATREVLSPSGKFRLQFDDSGTHAVPLADLDANGIPDYIDRAGEYADDSWHVMVDSLGYVDPLIPGSPYRIRFLSQGSYGYTQPSGSTTYIVVHSTFDGFPQNDDPDGDQLGALKVTIAHELKHAIQYTTSRWRGETGTVVWAEMDATMMEEVVYPQVNDYVSYTGGGSIFSNPTSSIPGAYAMASFSLFYHERIGPHFWVDVWNRIRNNNYISMRDAMNGNRKELYEEFFVANHLWHHASGTRAKEEYGFADRAILPTTSSVLLTNSADVTVGSLNKYSARHYRYVPTAQDTGHVYLLGYRLNDTIQFGVIAYLKDGSVVEGIKPVVRDFDRINTYEVFKLPNSVRFEDVDMIGVVVVNTGATNYSSTTARFSVAPIHRIPKVPYGDFNLDAQVNDQDLTDMLAHLVGKFSMNPSLNSVFRSDLTGNGVLTPLDAAYLFQNKLPADADAFGVGPGAARFEQTSFFDDMVWLDIDPFWYGINPQMQVESVAEGDTILVHLPFGSKVEARYGLLDEHRQALILSEVKNRAMPTSAQRTDWMQDSTFTRFVHVQSEATTGESRLTLSFRAVRKDTTVLVFQSGLIDESYFYRTDSITIITNPKTPVGLEREPERPSQLSLDNYPNPFNPSTEIRYRKSEIGRVRLAVYDILGRQVRILVDSSMPAGEHSIRFDAGNLSSGVYVLILDTDGQRLTRSITLIK